MEQAKKKVKKTSRKSPIEIVKTNLKRLSYSELEKILELAKRYRNEKIGNEELRLIKEKEELELKLKNLHDKEKKLNSF